MDKEMKKLVCEKCGTEMIRKSIPSPQSFGIFFTDTTSSSTATLVTTTTYPPSMRKPENQVIRIVIYVCPECGWEDQVRE